MDFRIMLLAGFTYYTKRRGALGGGLGTILELLQHIFKHEQIPPNYAIYSV